MPVLFGLMFILLVNAFTMDGFGQALDFVFGFHTENLTAAGVLEALGHAFFTLSLGMGAMLTYGSYLAKRDDIVSSAITICVLDTVIALANASMPPGERIIEAYPMATMATTMGTRRPMRSERYP